MLVILLLVAFPAMMAFAAVSDLLTMTIPNRLMLALAGTFAILVLAGGMPLGLVAFHVTAAALVLVLAFLMFARGWIGGGDAKLAAATTLWLGFDGLPDYMIAASIGGGLLTLAILVLRGLPLPLFATRWSWLSRLHDPKSGVPYGIVLAASALLVYPQTALWSAALAQ